MKTHQEIIERARADFLRARELLSNALSTTPDDRLNWSPSATARTPIQQVAHAASALRGIHEILSGRTLPFKSTAEADKSFREWEQQFTTREPVLRLLEESSAAYMQWLDALTPEALSATVELPFGLGSTPLAAALAFPANHTAWHAAQINYIQTIYGDQIWH